MANTETRIEFGSSIWGTPDDDQGIPVLVTVRRGRVAANGVARQLISCELLRDDPDLHEDLTPFERTELEYEGVEPAEPFV